MKPFEVIQNKHALYVHYNGEVINSFILTESIQFEIINHDCTVKRKSGVTTYQMSTFPLIQFYTINF